MGNRIGSERLLWGMACVGSCRRWSRLFLLYAAEPRRSSGRLSRRSSASRWPARRLRWIERMVQQERKPQMSAGLFAKSILAPFISVKLVAILTTAIYPSMNGTIAQAACIPTLLSPQANAELDNGRTDRSGSIIWDFDWSNCQGATLYQLYVQHVGSLNPAINISINRSSFHHECPECYVAEQNRFNWIWRVRAKVNNKWGGWSQARTFSVEPANSDRSTVGGSATGTRAIRVTCLNMTTGQTVIIQGEAASWDCEAAGLVVNTGDSIQQTVTGIAN